LRAGTRLLLVGIASLLLPSAARAQGFLNAFSYEGLRLAGIGFDVGGMWSDRLDPAVSGSIRVDAGFIAPHIRPLLSASIFHSRYAADEIQTLEDRLTTLVVDPTGQARVVIDEITLTNVTLDLDLQYVFTVGRVTPFMGLGMGIHIRDAAGSAIQGTFLEEALQAIVAAANATAGVEIRLSPRVNLTAEARGIAASGLMGLSARGGLMVRFPGRSGG
jgi:hypothetical protein